MRLNHTIQNSKPFFFINQAIMRKEEQIKRRCGNAVNYYDYDNKIYRNITSKYSYIDTAWTSEMHYEDHDDSYNL